MERKQFLISINASKEKVWEVLLGKETYPLWTSVFCEGSRVETDWKKGSRALFLDARNRGMVAAIAEHIPNEFLSIKHLGEINNGVEDLDSEKVKEWAGCLENYTLKGVDGKTELLVEMDVLEAFKDYFEATWPKALEKVKALSEENK